MSHKENDKLIDDVKDRELKPCPFCGEKGKIQSHPIAGHMAVGVECQNCFASSFQYCKAEQQAIKAWNTRTKGGER